MRARTTRTAAPAGGIERAANVPVAERATPLTILTPLRRWWVPWVRFTWLVARMTSLVARPLLRLSFIHFAHWSLVTRWPPDRSLPRERRVRRPWMIFQTNFNGSANQYIAAFCRVVPGRIGLLYGGAWGFPGTDHAGAVERYIDNHNIAASHFYCAYPQASVTMVNTALDLREHYEAFRRRAGGIGDPRAFQAAYRRFLDDVGHLL